MYNYTHGREYLKHSFTYNFCQNIISPMNKPFESIENSPITREFLRLFALGGQWLVLHSHTVGSQSQMIYLIIHPVEALCETGAVYRKLGDNNIERVENSDLFKKLTNLKVLWVHPSVLRMTETFSCSFLGLSQTDIFCSFLLLLTGSSTQPFYHHFSFSWCHSSPHLFHSRLFCNSSDRWQMDKAAFGLLKGQPFFNVISQPTWTKVLRS